MGVTHEPGNGWRVPHQGPRILVEVHADQNIPGDAHALDVLRLAILDLADFLHGHLHLEDVLTAGLPLAYRIVAATLQVLLHALLVAGIGVDDVPLAQLATQVLTELLVGILLLLSFGRVCIGRGIGSLDLIHDLAGFRVDDDTVLSCTSLGQRLLYRIHIDLVVL